MKQCIRQAAVGKGASALRTRSNASVDFHAPGARAPVKAIFVR